MGDEMIAERIYNFLIELIDKTNNEELDWQLVEKISTWEQIKKEIVNGKEFDLEDYYIDDKKSYVLNEGVGYVFALRMRYGNAPIFSPALDKYVLVVKINDEHEPENLSKYDAEEGYKGLLEELINLIEACKIYNNMPDSMYDFFDRILGGEKSGRVVDK